MKIEQTLESEISQEAIKLAIRYIEAKLQSFHEKVDFLGLAPTTDFRYSNLANVDLSDSDLRGFDFTGADLRGATGTNVIWDSTTVLDGADTSSSLFAYQLSKGRFFSEHPEYEDRVARLKSEYWATTILTVEATLRAREGKDSLGLQFAQAVFDEVEDRTVRSNILLHMSAAQKSREHHKEFIYNLLARSGNDPKTISVVIDTLAALYADDLDAFQVMRRFLRSTDSAVQRSATKGVFSSRHLFYAYDEVREIVVLSANPLMRRALVNRIALRELRKAAPLLRDDSINNYIDFQEEIRLDKLHRMARKSFALVESEYARELAERYGIKARSHSDEDQTEARGLLIRTVAGALGAKYKIRFALTAKETERIAV